MRNYGLSFDQPAHDWLSALPLGNGHMGVMMYGDLNCERLYVNDDTLWSGYPRDYNKADFRDNLERVRQLILAGERQEAQEIVENKMLGRFTQAYLPFGTIELAFQQESICDYRRWLNFSTGVARARCKKNGAEFNTTCFCSHPHDVVIYHIEGGEPFSFSTSFGCQLENQVSISQNALRICGIAPSDIIVGDVCAFTSEGNIVSYAQSEKSTRFFGELRIETDGELLADDKLRINHCRQATLYYSCFTSFAREDPQDVCSKTIEVAIQTGYERILHDHIADFNHLYNGVAIDFGGNERGTDEIYAQAKKGESDGYAIATLFQYGRYLLISSSREGTQPANLQGIWNKELIPPWWSGYTLNINLQMNYWHAQRTNLSDCVYPLIDFIERLKEKGEITARESYGMRGFVSHHQTDIWAQATPVGFTDKREKDSSCYAFWNLSAPWLCLHLYEHYLFTGDHKFLVQRAYPVFKSCADFLFDYLSLVNGSLSTLPSTSPENMYYGKQGEHLAICANAAMSIGILTEFFRVCSQVSRLSGDRDLEAKAETAIAQLPQYQVSRERLLEWDGDYTEIDPGHRHFSMLFGIYPYSHLLGKFREYAENALDHRLENGSASTGWSAVWAIALLARVGNSVEAERVIGHFIQNHLHRNLFGSHPPAYFQIDANFGFTAAICELVLQDYDETIRFIPALPKSLKSGCIRGLKTRGGHTVSLEWENYKLKWATILAGFEKKVRIAIRDTKVSCLNETVQTTSTDGGIEFFVDEGSLYKITEYHE